MNSVRRTLPLLPVLLLSAVSALAQPLTQADIDRRLTALPFERPAIRLPRIPDRRVSIVEFGAVGDGTTMNTKAFADAIAAVSAKGGGTVVVPAGHWMTGPIMLESNIALHTERGALVVFSPRFEDYPIVARPGSSTLKAHPPIWAVKAKNVAITGEGIFNGSGQAWRPVKKEKLPEKQWKDLIRSGGAVTDDGKIWFPSKAALDGEQYLKDLRKRSPKPTPAEVAGAREHLRPVMVEFFDCEAVLVEGITLTNSPAWTLGPVQSENVVIHRVTIVNPWWAQNADGVDLNATRNVLVSDCTIDTGDDAICIKPGTAPKKRRDAPSCENIIVTDCTVYHGHGGFVIGSESYGGARNLLGRNLSFIGTDIGLRFKSVPGRGGRIERVWLEDIRMKDIVNEAISFDMSYGGDLTIDVSDPERIPEFRDFVMRRITCDGAERPLYSSGLADMPVRNLTIESLTARSSKGALVSATDGLLMKQVSLEVAKGPVLETVNAQNIRVEGLTLRSPAAVLVRAGGSKTSGIDVQLVGGQVVSTPVETFDGATAAAVKVR